MVKLCAILLRLSRQNLKLFFRRVKADGLAPMHTPRPPLNPHFLQQLVQESLPFDPSILNNFSSPSTTPPKWQLPSDDDLRRHSRVPRYKSPGPDGVPPYLVYLLPPRLFHMVANGIRLSLQLTHAIPIFFDARKIT